MDEGKGVGVQQQDADRPTMVVGDQDGRLDDG